MAFMDNETQVIELVTHVAQQVQEGVETNAYLAYLHRLLQEKSPEIGSLNALITSFDLPQLRRLLHRSQLGDPLASPPTVPGRRITLYKAALPGETQARVAADSLIARYLCWLARNFRHRAIALANTDRHVRLFVPEGSKFDPEQAWHEFINFVFSGEELSRTFIAMLNSIQLSDRGFGVPEFPVVSEDQVLTVLAWLWHSVQATEQRLVGREKRIADLEARLSDTESKESNRIRKDIESLQEAQDKETLKYGENFDRRFSSFIGDQRKSIFEIQKLYNELNKNIKSKSKEANIKSKIEKSRINVELPEGKLSECEELLRNSNKSPFIFLKQFQGKYWEAFSRVQLLRPLFTERAVRQINLTRGDNLANAVVEIVRLTTWLENAGSDEIGAIRAQKFKPRALVSDNPEVLLERSPGDGTGEFCYVCGMRLTPEDEAQANRFIFRSPSQRLQSVRGEQRPPVCRHCVALAFVCPLKPSDQSVIIRLHPIGSHHRNERSAAMLGELEAFLRGLTLSQLDLAAGDYLMLTSSERVKVGNKWRSLIDVIGAVPYTHLRLADMFDYQVFKDYTSRIVTGISDIKIESHRLVFLSILIKALQLRLVEGSDTNRSLVTATRYVLADEPILAIYELVSQPHIDQRCRQEPVRIKMERALEEWTTMIDENRAQVISDVVAMVGLLYPFANLVRSKVKDNEIKSGKGERDAQETADRETSKVIEEVDEAFNFLYRFVDKTTSGTARLYRNPTNWFTYDQTKALLEKLEIGIGEREKTENNARFLEVNPNDVEAAYKRFAEGNYKDDADWRAFTYRLKLALYSRFPGLGVKR